MKKKSKKYVVVLSLFIVGVLTTTLNGCKDDCEDASNPDCCNYNPCYGEESTSAYFIIEESLRDYWIEGDTVSGIGNKSSVRFTAMQDADSFIWTLGSQTIREKSFTRNSFPSDRRIPVSLVTIRNHPNISCFPNDDGRDTFRRVMYTWPSESYYDEGEKKYVVDNPMPIQGRYLGYFDSEPNNQIEITLKDSVYRCTKVNPDNSYIGFNSRNIPKGYFNPTLDDDNCGYFISWNWAKRPLAADLEFKAYKIDAYTSSLTQDSLLRVKGFMQLSRDLQEVNITLRYYPLWDEIEQRTLKTDRFNGIKIE